MTRYTVVDTDCLENSLRNLDAEEAATIALTDDGHRFEIRESWDGQTHFGFDLWQTQRGGGGNVPMEKTVIYSVETDRKKAEEEIYRKVCDAPEDWFGVEILTDDQFEEFYSEYLNEAC